MSHKFVAGAGLLVLAGWGISGLAVAGSDIKQVDLTLRILHAGGGWCQSGGNSFSHRQQPGFDGRRAVRASAGCV